MADKDEKKVPKVFISYSHDSPEHKKWTANLSSELVDNGVDVILDQWDLGLGDDVPKFMEKSVSEADRVLMICTEAYVRKANEGQGGVGYEAMIVTGELVRDLGTSKFIPIIRQEGGTSLLPKSVNTRFYVNLSDNQDFAEQFEQLLRELHQEPAVTKPPLGKSPFAKQPSGAELPIKIEKQTEIPDLSKLDNDVVSIYNTALEIARQGDLVAWRKIIQQSKKPLADNILEWRKRADASQNMQEDEFNEMVLDGISMYAPLFALALAGIESGRDKFNNQVSMLDDILYPKEWNWSGLTRIVHFPFSVAYVYHCLHGAMALFTNQLNVSIVLARSRFETPRSSEKKPLFLYPEIIGWPESLGDNSSVAWKILNFLPDRWPWLLDAFGSSEEFRIAICAYNISLNILEYAHRISAGEKETILKKERVWPYIPPTFHDSDRDIKWRAYRLLIADPSQIRNIWYSFKLHDDEVDLLWADWIDLIRQWLRSAGTLGFRNDVIHKDLFKDLLS